MCAPSTVIPSSITTSEISSLAQGAESDAQSSIMPSPEIVRTPSFTE
jgi:hypothetical protein